MRARSCGLVGGCGAMVTLGGGSGAGGLLLQAARTASDVTRAARRMKFIASMCRKRMDLMDAALRSVLHLPGELTARRVDRLPTGLAYGGDEARILKLALKSDDAVARAGPEFRIGERIERNKVALARALR